MMPELPLNKTILHIEVYWFFVNYGCVKIDFTFFLG